MVPRSPESGCTEQETGSANAGPIVSPATKSWRYSTKKVIDCSFLCDVRTDNHRQYGSSKEDAQICANEARHRYHSSISLHNPELIIAGQRDARLYKTFPSHYFPYPVLTHHVERRTKIWEPSKPQKRKLSSAPSARSPRCPQISSSRPTKPSNHRTLS